jgi:hypothetical protein
MELHRSATRVRLQVRRAADPFMPKNFIEREDPMKAAHPIKPGVYYIVDLIHAGMDGAVTAEKTTIVPQDLVRSVLAATAAGAAVGAATATLNKRRSQYELAVKSLIGGAVGLGCGLAWASRKYTGSMARGAIRKINLTRDARWLEKNPIDYA